MNKFSVLMSVYQNDNASHLRLSLESIYDKQTRKPDEIVVVFDGPLTDELYDVLYSFQVGKEDVVFYYPQEVNKGLGEALRVGSEYCTGDYIFRMDADDISDAHRFEKQCAYIEANPDIDVLGTDIAEFESSTDEKMRVRSCPKYHDDIVEMSKRRNPMNHVSACIKKEALTKCGGYETLLLLEDYYLWLKMIVAGCKLENLNESLVYVRVGEGFHGKRGSRTRAIGWRVLQDYMLEHKLITRAEAWMNMLYIRGFVYCPAWVKRFVYDNMLRKRV